MNLKARRHHYLPQAYLAAFTKTGSKKDTFFVLDVSAGNSFSTSPMKVAVKRDFNRIDVDGIPIDALEQKLSNFEGQAIKAIRNVIKNEKFPDNEDLNWILNLLCLIAIRNPKFRKSFNRSREELLNQINDILVSNKKIWDYHMKRIRKSGTVIDEQVSFDEMKEFIGKRKYKIKFHPNGNMATEFDIFDEILPILGQRTWSLLVAPDDGPEFICSDHPVTLVWKNGKSGPVGFAIKETEVFFPLGRRIGLYGVFEKPRKPIVKLNPTIVAIMNLRTFLNAELHIFSANESFFMWYDSKIIKLCCRPNNNNIKNRTTE